LATVEPRLFSPRKFRKDAYMVRSLLNRWFCLILGALCLLMPTLAGCPISDHDGGEIDVTLEPSLVPIGGCGEPEIVPLSVQVGEVAE
jgi:hypothetical protein